MLERQFFNEKYIFQQDIDSGNSEVATQLSQLALKYDGGVMCSIVFSYDRTPDDLVRQISNIKDIILTKSGEIGTAIKNETFKIGEYRCVSSKEHSFNAVICVFYGGDSYNLNNSKDSSLYLNATTISSDIRTYSYEGSVINTLFFVSQDNGFLSIAFDDCPIAQQLYDSDFWNDECEKTVTNEPPQWYIASKEKSDASNKKGGCYVATSVYGSYDCPEVWTLRRFRDNNLATTWYGKMFISTYYAISPTIVKFFGKTKWFKKLCKNKLDDMVRKLNEEGVSDQPYSDK